MLKHSEQIATRQLDLVKFMQRQRMMMILALSSLTSSQLFFVEKLSKLDINECSSLEDAPTDDNSKHSKLMKNIQKSLVQPVLVQQKSLIDRQLQAMIQFHKKKKTQHSCEKNHHRSSLTEPEFSLNVSNQSMAQNQAQ